MAKLTRNLFIPLIDGNTLEGNGEEGYKWLRVDKSTIFDLTFNPQEETYGYIDTANDTTEIKSYQPELPQEIILDSSNPLFVAMFEFCMKMPTGADANVPCLIVTPDFTTNAATRGFLWKEASISPTDLNTVDGKLIFSMKLNGDPTPGTVAFDAETKAFTFTEAEGAATAALKF